MSAGLPGYDAWATASPPEDTAWAGALESITQDDCSECEHGVRATRTGVVGCAEERMRWMCSLGKDEVSEDVPDDCPVVLLRYHDLRDEARTGGREYDAEDDL